MVTNTMLEYSGANTGMITTKGFRDIIELRAGYKESHFDIRCPRPIRSYRDRIRQGVAERINYLGEVVIALDEARSPRCGPQAERTLRSSRSPSVCCSRFENAAHELPIREIIAEEYPEAVSLACRARCCPRCASWTASAPP